MLTSYRRILSNLLRTRYLKLHPKDMNSAQISSDSSVNIVETKLDGSQAVLINSCLVFSCNIG